MVTPATAKDLKVLMSALATPLDRDGELDVVMLRRLVEAYLGKGVEGFYCCGSSGEGLLLTEDERIRLVDVVCEVVAGRAPVVAHVGSLSTPGSIRLGRAARASGAVAISMIPPTYYTHTPEAVVGHYRAVMDAVDLPMILYNIPQFTSIEFTAKSGAELLADSRVIAVKHTAHNLFALERMKASFPDKAYINGFDEVFVPAMAAGAEGSIGTTVGFQYELFAAARAAFLAGRMDRAMEVQTMINTILADLVDIDVFPAAKYLSGRDAGGLGGLGDCRAPFRPLPAEDRQRLDQLDAYLAALLAELGRA